MPSSCADRLQILVVDGEANFAESVATAIEETAHEAGADAVTSATVAVERARSTERTVDGVVVGDAIEDPVSLIERLETVASTTTVLVTETTGNGSLVTDALESGASDCFPRTTASQQYELVVQTFATAEPTAGSPSGAVRTGVSKADRSYRQIFENVSDGLVIHDPTTGEILDVNERFAEMNGYRQEELLGETVDIVTAPDKEFSYEAAKSRIEQAASEGAQLFQWRNQRKDGTTFPVEVHLAVVQINGDQRVLASVRDITERQRRQREYEQIFNNVNDAIAIFDPETGDITDVNDAYHELLGYDDLETIQRLGIDGLSVTEEGYTGKKGKRLIQDVADQDEPKTVEWRGERRDGERLWLEATLAPAKIGGEQRVLSIQRDITARRHRERIIRALHDTTDRFQSAETPTAVCEAAVEAAEEVLDLSMPACWLPGDDGSLEPVAAAEAAWQIPGGPGVFEPDSFEYEIYEGSELRVYDPSKRWDRTPLDRAFLVPLGDYGLLGAAEPDIDSYDEVTLDAARILARHVRSALDRVERARELRESEERFRTIAERINEIIYLANADLTEVEYVNPAYADIYGRPVDELYEDARAFYRGVHPDDKEEFQATVEGMLEDVKAGNPDDSYSFSYRVERPDGEVRWIEATGYPILDDAGNPDRYVAVAEDATEQYRREQTLETFHEATRELTGAESRAAACRQAIRAADEVLGFPMVSAHLYDEGSGQLVPTAVTDRLEELDVDVPAFEPGSSLPWQVYVEGEATTETGEAADIYGPGVSGPDIVLPLGPHGVMLVGAPAGAFDATDVELTQILAATLEASLNHVADERALADREAQLEREQERAERLKELNDIIRDIERVTIEQSARAGIETAVCERLAAVDGHDLVWIGERKLGSDALQVRTSAGDNNSYLDAVPLAVDATAGGHPANTVTQNANPETISNIATETATGEWRKTALRHGIQSVVVVPISYESTVHGVLAVESEEPDAFDEATEEVLAELGRSIGYAITVTEREEALESEATTELEFSTSDPGLFLLRGATEAGCRIELDRTIRRAGGAFSTFYSIEGVEPTRLIETAERAASIETAQVVTAGEDDQSGLIEVRAPTWFGSVFSDYGAVVRKASADEGSGTIIVEAPRGTDIRALVEGFQERYPDSELVAQRQRERTVRSLFELQDALREGLTDRQWETLETAYSAGYFSWPRETSGQDVAELLGVTQPTFNKHLRVAERTAFRMLLDRDYPAETD